MDSTTLAGRMTTFTVTTAGADRLGLAAICQRFADEQWLAAHLTPDDAAAIVLDRFRRAVVAELELLDVKAKAEP